MKAGRGDPSALLREMVRVDSRNPSIASGAPGEGAAARALAETLRSWGIEAALRDALPGRPNVVATIRGAGKGRSLMFNGHIDVVGVNGMSHEPFAGVERDGRLYARGASDMKGGVAAMCAAASRLRGELAGDLVITAVVDEEWQSRGTSALLEEGIRADAAIVTEPTRLRVMPAHKGFVWLEVVVHGVAAHGSRWDLGVDAIRLAGHLLVEIDRIDAQDLPRATHPLLGRPSMHVGVAEGGRDLATYPDRCVLHIERRTIPGESTDDVMQEIDRACARVREQHPRFRADTRVLFAQASSDVPLDAPLVQTMREELRAHRLSDEPAGMTAWTDAALLNAAGIPAICFGPGDMGLAHAAEEYIDLSEVERATEILVDFARHWCGRRTA